MHKLFIKFYKAYPNQDTELYKIDVQWNMENKTKEIKIAKPVFNKFKIKGDLDK